MGEESKYFRVGFLFGFEGKTMEPNFEETMSHFDLQKDQLKKALLEEEKSLEVLIGKNNAELNELIKRRERMSSGRESNRPLLLFWTLLFYGISWLIAHGMVASVVQGKWMFFCLLIVNGLWIVLVFLFQYSGIAIGFFVKRLGLFSLLSAGIALLCGVPVFLRVQPVFYYPLLLLALLWSSVSLVLYIRCAGFNPFRNLIQEKEEQIHNMESRRNQQTIKIGNLADQIEEEKTNIIVDFWKGYLFGLSQKRM